MATDLAGNDASSIQPAVNSLTAPSAGRLAQSEVPEPVDSASAASFIWQVSTDSWWWSLGTYRLHGYRPGEFRPSTALFLSHVHAQDRMSVVAAIRWGVSETGMVVAEHRSIDFKGRTRNLVLIARSGCDPDGEIGTLDGVLLPFDRPAAENPYGWWTATIAFIAGISRDAATFLLAWHEALTDDTSDTVRLLSEIVLLGGGRSEIRRCFGDLFLRPALLASAVAVSTGGQQRGRPWI